MESRKLFLFVKHKRDIDIEDKYMDKKGERGSELNWEVGIDIYTLLICTK